jgi:MFS family permease
VLASAGAGDAYFPTVFIAFFLMGLGAGTSFMPLLTIALSDVPPRDAGVASALINVSLYISGALGLAVLGAIATDRTQALSAEGYAPAHALVGGFQLAFMIAAVCVAACVAVAAVVLRAGRLAPAHAA